ncbi:putative ribonuclease H-like domain-containing protein [Tanacetum coccineum]
MELENTQNNALAKLPMLKLGEYEMWEIRIKQYFQIQDYALWEVIENGNSWVPIPVTTPSETGTSTATKMTMPSTTEEKTCKKNDVKARSLLLMALPNEHQLTFDHTASFSDAIVYAFLSTQPQGSQLVHEDLEQLHDDDIGEMDLKWNMALLSMRARKFYQRTGRKIIIDGSNTAGYDKSKVECFNCHKMGHFARECRAPRSKDNRNWNQGSSSKAVNFEMEDVLKRQSLKKQYDDLLVKLDDTGFKASTYKRGLSILEGQILKYKESEVLFSKEIALLKRSVGHKEYLMGLLKTELEKVKEEKEGFEFKIAKFEKSSKDLDDLLASQVTDKSKKGFGYNVVPSPHPLILNRPTPLDLSYSGLEEFKQPEVNEYGPRDSSLKPTTGCDKESDNSKENTDDSLKQQQKTASETSFVKSPLKVDKDWKEKFFYDEEEVEPIPKVEKKTAIPTATKKESVKPEKPIRRSVRYAEMYRSQGPRGNQRNWNGQKSNQLGCNFVFNNKACFNCGGFDHIQYSCPKHMVPRAVLMKTGLKTVNNARLVNTVRSVNTARPFSTARSFNTVRPSYTAHPKSIVHCARPRTYFQNQAQSTVQRPFYKRTTLTKRSYNQNVNTGRQNVNTVRARGFNAVKPSACWVWRPIKPNGASLSNSQLNDKGFVDSGCSRHMSGNIAHLSDFKDFDGGYVTFGGGANGGRITGKGTIKTDKLDFDDLPDENQILLKIPRQDNMYSFDMKNIVPKDGLTCLVAKATSEESMLRAQKVFGHVNFKNINKLVKENLVRDLPLKRFENDQTCVACLKGKQHRASYRKPSGKKVKIIRSDNGTEFKNKVMDEFCREKEGNGPKWLFDLDSLTQSIFWGIMISSGCKGTFSNDFVVLRVSEFCTSSQQDQANQDCILMPIWKDASYFDDASPRSVADAQIQDQSGLHDEIDDSEKKKRLMR